MMDRYMGAEAELEIDQRWQLLIANMVEIS